MLAEKIAHALGSRAAKTIADLDHKPAVVLLPISVSLEPRHFTVDDYRSPRGRHSNHFHVNGWDVWGVTARIIVQFLELVYDFKIESR